MLISQSEIQSAESRIRPILNPTPVIRSRFHSARVRAQVWLKLENLQPTHSFKVRGAFNAVLSIPPELRQRGVVTASGGNHGLGVALAAFSQKIPADIYLPIHTPQIKIDAIQRLGAQVTLYGSVWDETNRQAMEMARKEGKSYIHPFDNPYVMAGQGTIVTELLRQLSSIDVIVASIGGGGLISGIISAAKQFSPATRVVGVETIGADCMYQSRAAGKIVELPAITSIAESLGAKKTEPTQFGIITQHVSDLIRVSDQAAVRALLETLQEEKMLIEPAAACCLAALASGEIPVRPDETVVVIVCGANVALDQVMKQQALRGYAASKGSSYPSAMDGFPLPIMLTCSAGRKPRHNLFHVTKVGLQ
jgi:threonine dehydratase